MKASSPPPYKKMKSEEAVSVVSSLTDPTSRIEGSQVQCSESGCGLDGYLINIIKKQYNNKDLPVPTDHRWSRAFVSTATLWCSVQPNVWNVLDEQLASALQQIFEVVYPDIKYRVTPTGSVFLVVSIWPKKFLAHWLS